MKWGWANSTGEDGPWNDDTVSASWLQQSLAQLSLNLQQPDADAWAQTYMYDAARRLTNITTPAGARCTV